MAGKSAHVCAFFIRVKPTNFYKYANKYLELTSEKQRSQICYATDVPVDHRCVFWGFPSVIFKFRLSALKTFCWSSVTKPPGIRNL